MTTEEAREMTTEEALEMADGIKFVFADCDGDRAMIALAAEVRMLRADIATVKARTCVHCGCMVNVGGQCENCLEVERLRAEVRGVHAELFSERDLIARLREGLEAIRAHRDNLLADAHSRAFTPATVREKWQSEENPPVDRLDIERYFVVVTRGGMRFVAWRDGEQWIIHKPYESGTMTLDNVRLWLELPKLDDQERGATAAEAPTESTEVPCSEFRLPVVAGRRSLQSNADFERACLVHIERLQLGIGDYDSAMLATFAEAVRMVREYTDAMQVRNHNTGLSGER